jgi:peroxiredoxin
MMNSTDNEFLQKAEQLLREGKKQQAAPLLEEFLRGNINSARGWWALSFAVSDVEEQIECVERVLKLNPTHTGAQARLEKLKSATPSSNRETSAKVPTPRKKKQNQTLQYSVLAVMGCIALALFGIAGVMIVRGAGANPAQVSVNTGTPVGISLPPTWTPTPTVISLSTETPQPTAATVVASTPTSDLLLTAVAQSKVGPVRGYFAPDFKARNISTGQVEKLGDYKGRAVLVFFWATWCPYCEREAPSLQSIYKVYQDDGFAILGIDVGEDASLASAYVDRHFLTYSVFDDENRTISGLYQVTAFPSHFFIDPNGVITQITIGEMNYWGLDAQIKADLGLP